MTHFYMCHYSTPSQYIIIYSEIEYLQHIYVYIKLYNLSICYIFNIVHVVVK